MADPTQAQRLAPSLAVVGLACRFPDADDAPELLEVVLTGRRAFRRIPPVRLDLADYFQADRDTSDATYSTRAALLEGWQFDCAAFGIEPAAYAAADPALWLALETTARALAGAGLTGGTGLDRDRTGVIIGNTLGGDTSRANALRVRWPYVRRVLTDALSSQQLSPGQSGAVLRRAERQYLAPFPVIGPATLAGGSAGTIAAAICNYFGFRGGSHAIDSACSSSTQAVASACTALAAGEIDVAVAGGVDISIDPLELIGLAKAGVLATDGVRIYDEEPGGYLPAEGCGVVVLMRTADARAADLPVYAEITGWGTSATSHAEQDERRVSSQLLAMQRAYERAGLDPREILLFEGNGAGTREDDDAELAALGVLRQGALTPAVLGSVKANIGHAKAAAGIASLIKTVLAVSNGVLPPATGVRRPHPMITEGDARLTLPQITQEWPEGVRHAAVSTLNVAGANVHLVVRGGHTGRPRQDRGWRSRLMPARSLDPHDPVVPRLMADAGEPVPFLLQAPDRFALAAVLNRLAAIARWLSDAEMQDLACSLGRDPGAPGPCRVALVAADQEQLGSLAATAASMLADLAGGLLTVVPGIFAAQDADGRITLLLSDTRQDPAAAEPLTGAVSGCLEALRWLESLDVQAAAAVGHGMGALAGLAWAGVLGQDEVTEIADLRAKFRRRSVVVAGPAGPASLREPAEPAEPADGAEPTRPDRRVDAIALRAAIGQKYRFGPPRRRLISTFTGAEVGSVDDAIDLICSGFAGAAHVADAISAGAVGATLLVETGPGTALADSAAATAAVPAVSLATGTSDLAGSAAAVAALFAAGALGQPQAFFAGWPGRAIDIWRERTFIVGPCETRPRIVGATPRAGTAVVPEQAAPVDVDPPAGEAAAPAEATAPTGESSEAAAPTAVAAGLAAEAGAASPAASGTAPVAEAATPGADADGLATAPETTATAAGNGTAPAEMTAPAATAAAGYAEVTDVAALIAEVHAALAPDDAVAAAQSNGHGGVSASADDTVPPIEAAAPTADAITPAPAADDAAAATDAAGPTAVRTAFPGAAMVVRAARAIAAAVETAAPDAETAAPDAETAAPDAETAATDAETAATDAETMVPAATTETAAPPAESVKADPPGAVAATAPSPVAVDLATDDGDGHDEAPADPPRGPSLADVRAQFERQLPDLLADPVTGAGPWARCYAEVVRPAVHPATGHKPLRWRLHVSGNRARLAAARSVFRSAANAKRTLAIIGDPADDDARAVAVQAAREAIETGELVVVTTSSDFTGFFAGLHAEHPRLGITVLRVPGADGVALAPKYAHATAGKFRELILAPDGSAGEPAMSELTLTGGAPFPLGPDDVVLVSRGTRGAGLALAQVLACCGSAVVMIGRPEDDDHELVAGLEELRSAGAKVGYEVIDLASPTGLAAAVNRVEARLGPVTAIGHAVSPSDPVPFPDLTDIEICDHAANEAAVLTRLVASVQPGQLRMIITFGSVAGRYGLPGGAVTALSSAALATKAGELAAAGGGRSLHIDIAGWSSPGLGDRSELADYLAAAGTMAIDVGAASRLLLKIMTTPELPERVALHGRVSGPAARITSVPERAEITPDQLAAAGLPGGGRFLANTLVHYPGIELICAPSVALDSDPYLADYQVDGLPMLPPALAVEALAQAASVLAGKPTRSASRVRLESPVVVPAGGQAELRICALRDGPLISAVLRCADSSFTVDHARAEFNCADCDELPPALMTPDTAQAALKQLVGAQSGLVDGAELYGPISFQDGRFRRIALLPEVTSRSCRALARGSDDQPWFEPGSAFADSQFLLGSPGLADATLQVLQASMPHRRLRTAGCATVRFSGKAAEGAVEIRAMAVPDVTAVPALGPAPAAEADPAFAVATASAAAEIADVRPLAPRPRSRKARRGLRHQAQAARHAPAGQDQAGQDQAGQDQAESAQTQQGPEARGRQPATFPAQAVPVQGRSPVWEHVGPPPVTVRTPGDQIAGQRWDIEAVDATGHLLLVWRGVEVRDAGPMPRRSAWPPPLLAVYLERTARDSGLDVSLRVSVRSGHLEGVRPGLLAAPVAAAAPVVPGPRPHDAAETPAAEEVPPADTAQPWGRRWPTRRWPTRRWPTRRPGGTRRPIRTRSPASASRYRRRCRSRAPGQSSTPDTGRRSRPPRSPPCTRSCARSWTSPRCCSRPGCGSSARAWPTPEPTKAGGYRRQRAKAGSCCTAAPSASRVRSRS